MAKKILKFIFIFLTIINTIKASDCLNENINENNVGTTLPLSTCTQHSYNNIILNGEYNETNITKLDCCLLKIDQDSNPDITKCIEIQNDEDEIERRITAFEAMYKDAIITIDCQSLFIRTKFLQIFLLYIICFLL